jgi:hypothetical protein
MCHPTPYRHTNLDVLSVLRYGVVLSNIVLAPLTHLVKLVRAHVAPSPLRVRVALIWNGRLLSCWEFEELITLLQLGNALALFLKLAIFGDFKISTYPCIALLNHCSI